MATTRRDILRLTGAALAAAPVASSAGPSKAQTEVPRRALGKTGEQVSVLGLGGYHLGLLREEKAAVRLVHEALDGGINFLDNAWEYHDGQSELWMGKALEGRRDKAFVMSKCCSHGRDKKTALEQLHTTLRRLKTDRLDLWQIHEVAWDDDPKKHLMPGGAVEALAEAKKAGKVRFVGFTGHKRPQLHLEMLASGFPFDTVQLPVNPFDAHFRSFRKEVLPKLEKRGIAAIAMKSLGGTGACIKAGLCTVEESLRYVLSQNISTLVSGIDSLEVLHQNLSVARGFKPMTDEEQRALEARLLPRAGDGTFELYKTTRTFEGPIGRAQHGLSPEG